MRRVLGLVLLAVVGAVADAAVVEDAPLAADVAAAQAAVDESRGQMEAHYLALAREHAKLRRLGAQLREAQKSGEPPEWLSDARTVAAMSALADDARAKTDDRSAEYRPLTDFLPASVATWPTWADAVADRAHAFAQLDDEAGGADLLVRALLVVADTPMDAAWDGWFQSEPVVVEWRARNARLAEARVFQAASAPTELVRLDKGRFEVGPWEGWLNDLGPKDNKRTKISVKVIHVDRHEVTCAQYHAFVAAADAEDRAGLLPAGWTLDDAGAPVLPAGRAGHPVTGVTIVQARQYAASLGKRLPTEDEWERIAAGGDELRLYPWGPETKGKRWVHKDEAGGATAPAALHGDDASVEGVLGLAGNVKELVATTSDRKPVKARVKPDAKIVVRGGGFRTRASECQTRWRWFIEAGKSADDVGFRCVMDDAEFKRRNPR